MALCMKVYMMYLFVGSARLTREVKPLKQLQFLVLAGTLV